MHHLHLCLLTAFLGVSMEAGFCNITRVSSPEALREAVAQAVPGDEVIIQDGTWRDVLVRIIGEGTEAAPIRIRPETPGGLKITGESRVRIGGSYLEISNLHLINIHGVSDVLQFREDSKNLAHHCRVTGCAFEETEDFDPGKTDSRWVGLYGKSNRFDHCWMAGKKSRGATLVVWPEEGERAAHWIHHNHFGHRPPLGRNGGETIRIGDSKTSAVNTSCVVEHNLFERCNGEAECISNKSCENLYRHNWFVRVEGTLTLRHGHRCRVENNVFIGHGLKHTGGIRIIGQDHVVKGNQLFHLRGTDGRGAIVLQNGIQDSPANGYEPVIRALVEDNYVFGCRESLVLGYADKDSPQSTVAPRDCNFRDNAFLAGTDDPVVIEHHACENATWEGNLATGKELGFAKPSKGLEFSSGAPDLKSQRPVPEMKEAAGPAWLDR